jgi:hypothetical protein
MYGLFFFYFMKYPVSQHFSRKYITRHDMAQIHSTIKVGSAAIIVLFRNFNTDFLCSSNHSTTTPLLCEAEIKEQRSARHRRGNDPTL